MEKPMNAAELARMIARLSRLTPVARAREARRLIDDAKRVLSATADEAVEDATKQMTYADLAAELDVTPAAVNKAVSRHRRRLGD